MAAFFSLFLMWTILKLFTEFVTILFLFYVFVFFGCCLFLVMGHVGSELLDWGLNLYPLHRKANS